MCARARAIVACNPQCVATMRECGATANETKKDKKKKKKKTHIEQEFTGSARNSASNDHRECMCLYAGNILSVPCRSEPLHDQTSLAHSLFCVCVCVRILSLHFGFSDKNTQKNVRAVRMIFNALVVLKFHRVSYCPHEKSCAAYRKTLSVPVDFSPKDISAKTAIDQIGFVFFSCEFPFSTGQKLDSGRRRYRQNRKRTAFVFHWTANLIKRFYSRHSVCASG